ncbi:hypothetical protein C0995_005159, partial [Termitomyces sp. Mi166
WMDLQGSLWKTNPPVKHQEKGLLKRLLQPKAVAEAPLVQRERGSAPPVLEGSSMQSDQVFCSDDTREVLMHIGKRCLLP